MRTITKIFIHCSASKEGQNFNAKDIDTWHKKRGFNSIGYHYVILLDGTIEKGRAVEKVGSHCKGQNTASIGICYIGGCDEYGNPKDTRNDKQKAAMQSLITKLQSEYPKATIHGHNEYSNKACPSFIVANEYGSVNNKSGEVTGIWGRGDNHKKVAIIQDRLNELGYNLKVDGDFGINTDYVVRQFQECNDLKIDGLVGDETLEALFQSTKIKRKPMRDEREYISGKELKKTSTIVKNSQDITKAGSSIIGLPIAWGGAKLLVDKVNELDESYQTIKNMVSELAGQNNFTMIMLLLFALYILYKSKKVEVARIKDHRTGKTI